MKYLLGCLGLVALCLAVNANRVERDCKYTILYIILNYFFVNQTILM